MLRYIMLFLIFSLFAITNGYSQENNSLSYEEFIINAKSTKGVIIDARTPQEYDSGHLANSVLIDFLSPDFTDKISKLDRNGHYFLYCRSGNRTGKALNQMKEMGFKNVFHLKGGVIGIEQANVLITD
jgi:phage shock protein E